MACEISAKVSAVKNGVDGYQNMHPTVSFSGSPIALVLMVLRSMSPLCLKLDLPPLQRNQDKSIVSIRKRIHKQCANQRHFASWEYQTTL